MLVDTDAVPTALFDIEELLDFHRSAPNPGLYVVNEPASAINAGLVIVPREHSRAQERYTPVPLEEYMWSRLQALIREAQGPSKESPPRLNGAPLALTHAFPSLNGNG